MNMYFVYHLNLKEISKVILYFNKQKQQKKKTECNAQTNER